MPQYITTIPYNKVQFKFVTSHYDVHLKGTCIYNNSLCEFVCNYPEYNDETDKFEDVFAKIYKLSFTEKLKRLYKQHLFEICIGHHYSYKNGKKGKPFRYRKPKWLFTWLFNTYYKKFKTINRRLYTNKNQTYENLTPSSTKVKTKDLTS